MSACQHEDTRLVEDGYTRTWGLKRIDGRLVAYYSGSEDWSEEGDGVLWIECVTCLHREAVPLGEEVDWQ